MIVDPAMFEIGKRNCLAVKKAFWKLGLFIDQEDIGGFETRSVRLDLDTGRVDMKKGAGPGRILVPAGINLIGREQNEASLGR
jgi:chemotaxis protein CheD